MSFPQIASWVLSAVLVFWAVGAYNRLMHLRGRIGEAFLPIDAQLRRRHELIARLVEAAREHVEHEREALQAVAAANDQARLAAESVRVKPADAGAVETLRTAEQGLDAAFERLRTLAENYPELKEDRALRELGEEMGQGESRLVFARQAFNETVLGYNEAVQQVPTRLIAAVFGFRAAGLLQFDDGVPGRGSMRLPF